MSDVEPLPEVPLSGRNNMKDELAQMDFRDLFRQVAARPGMFLFCDSYLALTSFISGCDAATERRLLDGFSAWVAERTPGVGETSFTWVALVAARHWPVLLDEGPGRVSIKDLPAPLQDPIKDDLMYLLDEFLAERYDGKQAL